MRAQLASLPTWEADPQGRPRLVHSRSRKTAREGTKHELDPSLWLHRYCSKVQLQQHQCVDNICYVATVQSASFCHPCMRRPECSSLRHAWTYLTVLRR